VATSEERMKILKMIEEGRISPEDGTRLLAALSKGEPRKPAEGSGDARWLRIRVTDLASGRLVVNANLPVSLVNVGLRMGARFVPEMNGEQMDTIGEALRQGVTGKIMDITDESEGQRIEVYVE
jgi:hypothetical protein